MKMILLKLGLMRILWELQSAPLGLPLANLTLLQTGLWARLERHLLQFVGLGAALRLVPLRASSLCCFYHGSRSVLQAVKAACQKDSCSTGEDMYGFQQTAGQRQEPVVLADLVQAPAMLQGAFYVFNTPDIVNRVCLQPEKRS